MPSPLSTVAMGRRNGSASLATNRSATCIPRTSTASPPPSTSRLLSISPCAPSCTRTMAAPLIPHANSSSTSSRLRRRAGTRSFSLIDWVKVLRSGDFSAVTGAVRALLPADIRQPPHNVPGILEVVRGDRLLDLLPLERRQLVELDAGHLVHAGELDRPDVLLHALEDRDRVPVGPDEVVGLRPAVACDEQGDQQSDDQRNGDQPGDAPAAMTPAVFGDEFLQVLV